MHDPFEEQNRKILEAMDKGLGRVLEMHNGTELSSLASVLNLKTGKQPKEKKRRIQDHIRSQAIGPHATQMYQKILTLMWEGTLFEYLRQVGMPIAKRSDDPRRYVFLYWTQSAGQIEKDFNPIYISRRVRARNYYEVDQDMKDAALEIEKKEIVVKGVEKKLRREHDYRNVLLYFSVWLDKNFTFIFA